MYYDKEIIEKAKKIDLVNFCRHYNFDLQKQGMTKLGQISYKIVHKRLGGLFVYENSNGYYWSSGNPQKGNAIDFCKLLFNDTYQGAIKRLLEFQGLKITEPIIINKPKEIIKTKEFIMPESDKNQDKIIAYLNKTRMIDMTIIGDQLNMGNIRQFSQKEINKIETKENQIDKPYTYLGLIGFDKNREPKYLFIRSVLSGSSYRRNISNSHTEYGFIINYNLNKIKENQKEIYLFEAGIDAMSYMTMLKRNNETYKDKIFISNGGLFDSTFNQFMKDYNNGQIKTINLCFDNDKTESINHGQERAKIMQEQLKRDFEVKIITPQNKDFNEDLQNLLKKNNIKKIVSQTP